MNEVGPSGPRLARIMIVGEAPGKDEVEAGRPFVGASGRLLDRMLAEVGINRDQCFVTNVCRVRPPNNDITKFFKGKIGNKPSPEVLSGLSLLHADIHEIRPEIIIALGNTALWALTDRPSIEDWRGSQLRQPHGWLIPTYHPAAILREWSLKAIAGHDLRKAAAISQGRVPPEPEYDFLLKPTFEDAMKTLDRLKLQADYGSPLKISVDIETFKRQHITCVGLAWSATEAICLPFMSVSQAPGYWNSDQEITIVQALRKLFTHPNVQVIGQNFAYDAQYFARHWGILVKPWFDTMTAQHVCWPGTPKALDYLSSMYCEHHVYWKHLGKEWTPALPEEQHWHYNCLDCVKTFEIAQALNPLIDRLGLREPFDFQMSLFEPVLKMMLRGIHFDTARQKELEVELRQVEDACMARLEVLCGHVLNPRSPVQLKKFFYDDLKIKPVYNRTTGAMSTNNEALEKLAKREPIIARIVELIQAYRSASVYRATFIQTELDTDQRMRCSFNVSGTETFRFSSSTDAFGFGMNLQNIPGEDK